MLDYKIYKAINIQILNDCVIAYLDECTSLNNIHQHVLVYYVVAQMSKEHPEIYSIIYDIMRIMNTIDP